MNLGIFQTQLGSKVRSTEALQVAASFFCDGLDRFQAGELDGALDLFQRALAINQKYLLPSSSGCVLCYNNIAAVYDRKGELGQAAAMYERAQRELLSDKLPRDERSRAAKAKRQEMLRHVREKLERMPRTAEPKVGAGVAVSEVHALVRSLWSEGEAQRRDGKYTEALLSYEQVLALNKRFGGAGLDGLAAIADTLARIGLVHHHLGDLARAEAHLAHAEELLLQLPADADAAADDGPRSRLPELQATLAQMRAAHNGAASPAAAAAGPSNGAAGPSNGVVAASNGGGGASSSSEAGSPMPPPVVSIESLERFLQTGERKAAAAGATPPPPAQRPPPGSAGAAAGSSSSGHQTPPSVKSTASATTPEAVGRQVKFAAEQMTGALHAGIEAVAAARASQVAGEGIAPPTPDSKAKDGAGSAAAASDGAAAAAVTLPPSAAAAEEASHAGEEPAVSRFATAPAKMNPSVEEEDEFAWRAGAESDGEDDGPVDDRVETALAAVNDTRDGMNARQLELDGARRQLKRAEEHTAAELARMEAEHADALRRVAEYDGTRLGPGASHAQPHSSLITHLSRSLLPRLQVRGAQAAQRMRDAAGRRGRRLRRGVGGGARAEETRGAAAANRIA